MNLGHLFSPMKWIPVLVFFETVSLVIQTCRSCFVLFLEKYCNLINWRCLIRSFRSDCQHLQELILRCRSDFLLRFAFSIYVDSNHVRLYMFDWQPRIWGVEVMELGSFYLILCMNFTSGAPSFVLSGLWGLLKVFAVSILLISFSSFMNFTATKPNFYLFCLLTSFSASSHFCR